MSRRAPWSGGSDLVITDLVIADAVITDIRLEASALRAAPFEFRATYLVCGLMSTPAITDIVLRYH
jgi:hypothetical protein